MGIYCERHCFCGQPTWMFFNGWWQWVRECCKCHRRISE